MTAVDLRVRLARMREQRWLFVGAVAGLTFVAIFALCAPLSKDAYAYRDDAVITLSHAKNLVEFGSIGVDAAGARVEGFSTPLQFWLFVVVYAVTRCGYESFLDAQVPICTFLLGFAVVQLFGRRWQIGLPLTAAVALALCQAVRFFGWHHSGMENAYTHALFVATLGGIAYSIESGRVGVWMVGLAWLASLSRLESMLHVFPLLVIWAAVHRAQHRNLRALVGALTVVSAWALYQLWRYAYFGDLRPNTAVAEQIDVLARVRAFIIAPEEVRQAVLGVIKQIMGEHRAYLALLSVPLLVLATRSPVNDALVWMLGSLFATALIHPVLFGAARLDPVRTTSHLALIPPLLITTQWARIARPLPRSIAFVGVAIGALAYAGLEPHSDHFFCCPIKRADAIANVCLAQAKRDALPAPSLASPDLGKQSFRKRFLMFDLGLLGSPPLAALHGERRAFANYLFELAAPDYIEMHGSWACEYSYLQSDARFKASYALVPESKGLHLDPGCRGARSGVFFRRDVSRASTTAERALIDDLAKDPDPGRVAAELGRCQRQNDRLACAYVTRSVYRFMNGFAERGTLARVAALFEHSPSALYDQSLLGAREHGDWHLAVVAFARSL